MSVPPSRTISARIALLDKQLVDVEGLPFGRVDDVELRFAEERPPEVTALLTGAEALGPRLGGPVGRLMTAAAARLRSRSTPSGPPKIGPELIEEIEPLIRLTVPLSELPQAAALERWLGARIARLPGAGDAPQ